MISINQLNKKQEDYIRKLDDAGLKTYIDNIAKSYYLNVISNDKLSVNNSIETLNKIKMLHSDKNIDAYINYALISVFNDIFAIGSSENINQYMKEPSLNTYITGYIPKSDLDKIFDYKIFQDALEIEKEFKKKCKSDDDIKKLYNYDKYI